MTSPMRQFNPDIDYYEILQVHPGAHREVIKRAYRTIVTMLQAHPDLGGSHERAVQLNEAYAVLSDEASRQAYDAARRQRTGAAAAPRTRQATAPASPPPTASDRPRHHEAARRPAERQTVHCPRCGARNRLRAGTDLRTTHCGKCRGSLHHEPADAEPVPAQGLRLPRVLEEQLIRLGELRLHPIRVPADRLCHCRRCRHRWQAAGDCVPVACPRCHSPHWGDFRLFRCRHCRQRFTSGTALMLAHALPLIWPWAYWVAPICPSCGQSRWHDGCERHPLRLVLNLGNRRTPRP